MTTALTEMTSVDAFRGHACATPASEEQLWEMTATYIAAGLANGEKVSYFDDGTSERVLERLLDDDVAIDEPLDTGQFTIVPAAIANAAPRGPLVDIASLFDRQISAALDAGWRGLRVTGQLDRGTRRRNSVMLQAYESALDDVVRSAPITAFCFYHRGHYPDDIIAAMRAAHAVVIDAPAVYDDNLLRITTTGAGATRLAGEVDHSNRPQIRRLLDAALEAALRASGPPTDITLDVRSLRFIDVAGAVDLVHAAEEFPSSHRLILHGARPRVARLLDRCGALLARQMVIVPWA